MGVCDCQPGATDTKNKPRTRPPPPLSSLMNLLKSVELFIFKFLKHATFSLSCVFRDIHLLKMKLQN